MVHYRLSMYNNNTIKGIGYYPSGATTMVGIKDTDDWEDHVFPHATHYDWYQNDFTFLVQFYGLKKDPEVVAKIDMVYLLYDGDLISMEMIVGNYSTGFFRVEANKTTECEPYAFIAKDRNNDWWRLPEDERYYFSTVDHSDELVEGTADCVENHYFYTGNEWVANGGYNLTNAKNTDNGCVGCDKVLILENIWENRDDIAIDPTQEPTSDPTTAQPTADTDNPTSKPTTDPTQGMLCFYFKRFFIIM